MNKRMRFSVNAADAMPAEGKTSMKRRVSLLSTFLLVTQLAIPSGNAGEEKTSSQKAGRPNVIIIMTDDQGYGDLSCHGNPVLKTPNMDKLHSESVRFTRFHVTPKCTPTRGQLMTGMDALRNGATSVTAGRAVVRRGIPFMPEVFAAGGYRTGLFGKWHLGDNYPFRPMDRGFDESVYFRGWGYPSAPEFCGTYFNAPYLRNGKLSSYKGYCTDFWFDEAMKWMKDTKQMDKPFFCYLPSNTPHGPAIADDKYCAPYTGKDIPTKFFGMIANLDENIGRLDKFLAENGLRENTILIFMTDNGGTEGVQLYNAGMRGKKYTAYEGGHRVPCFVRWPQGVLNAPRDVTVESCNQDILPTLIDLCGLTKPAHAKFDGTSLAGLVKGTEEKIADRMIVAQQGENPAMWEGCVIWNQWRLVNKDELYDIKTDPGQKINIAREHPDVLGKMQEHYKKWWAGIEPVLAEYSTISIGSDKENPVELSCSDWQKLYCDNTHDICFAVKGQGRGELWHIRVETDGEYEVRLRRWPPQLGLPLTAPLKPEEFLQRLGCLPKGKALPIAGAKLAVAGQELTGEISGDGKYAVFNVRLKAMAKTTMQGWFLDETGKDLIGAYYATVERL